MTPDMERLCEAAIIGFESESLGREMRRYEAEAIVRAVLLALKEATGETERYAAGKWSRRNVEAMVSDILADPAKA